MTNADESLPGILELTCMRYDMCYVSNVDNLTEIASWCSSMGTSDYSDPVKVVRKELHLRQEELR